MSQRNICFHCGADKSLHQFGTNKCPKYGREAYLNEVQEWEDTTYIDRGIRINEESWHAQIFQYWSNYNTKLPDNLCPYFWTTLSYCLLTIPLTIFALPIILFNTLRKLIVPNQASWFYSIMDDKAKELIMLQMFVYFGIVALFLVIALEVIFVNVFILGNEVPEKTVVLTFVSLIANLVYLFLLLRYSIRKFFKKSEEEDGKRITGVGTLMVEAIKSKYKKVCPRITWIKNNES